MTITTLDAELANTERILIDSSTLIAFHEGLGRAHPLAVHVLERITAAHNLLFRHSFLAEFPNLTWLLMNLAIVTQATTLRSIENTHLPDSIIASDLLAGCEVVVSGDAAWKRRFAPFFRQFRWIFFGDRLPA